MASTTMSRPHPNPGASRTAPRRPRRRRWLVLLAVLLVAALVGGGIWLLGFSSALATRSVVVTGNDVLSRDQVTTAAGIPLGRPLARQDLEAAAARVAALAPVESVRVDRRWPDTVAVDVTERTGVIAVREAGAYAVVDRFGVPFQTVTQLPAGTVLAAIPTGNTDALVAAGQVAAGLPARLAKRVQSIRAPSPTTVTVVLDRGPVVTWGSSADTALKAQIVLAFLEQEKSYRSLDVSAPHNPAVR